MRLTQVGATKRQANMPAKSAKVFVGPSPTPIYTPGQTTPLSNRQPGTKCSSGSVWLGTQKRLPCAQICALNRDSGTLASTAPTTLHTPGMY